MKAFENDAAAIGEMVEAEGWMIERYKTLMAFPGWRERILDASAPLPKYTSVLDAQRLLLMQAWIAAGRADAQGVKTLLEQDVVFWRKTLASSDILMTKMIAVAALKRHFAWANLALQRLPQSAASEAIPAQWRVPLSALERSMLRTSIGKFIWTNKETRNFKRNTASEPWFRRIMAPTFQYQDTMNRYAQQVAANAHALAVSYEAFPAAVVRARAMAAKFGEDGFSFLPYNFAGRIVLADGGPDFTKYAIAVSDVEGLRRIALLATELRTLKSSARMQEQLDRAALRNPYDGKPFQWDDGAGSLVFVGLEPRPRGHHAILY